MLSPSAHTSSIGNVMLPMMSPARNHLDSDGLSFSKVNWLGNIVADMNYMHFNLSKGSFDFHTLIFNYGEQLETDITGVVTGRFSPMSSVWSAGWGGLVKGYNGSCNTCDRTRDLQWTIQSARWQNGSGVWYSYITGTNTTSPTFALTLMY